MHNVFWKVFLQFHKPQFPFEWPTCRSQHVANQEQQIVASMKLENLNGQPCCFLAEARELPPPPPL